MKRKSPHVDVSLLQKAHGELQREVSQLRNVLFSLVKEAGRLRIHRATIETLGPEDGINAVLDAASDDYIITYVKHAPGESPKESA